MERSQSELEDIVRNKICGVCTDRTVDGQCGLEEPAGCALFRLFPAVVGAIQSVKSDDIHQYIEAIRRNVCAVCSEESSDGSCAKRRQVQCALDAYLILVVDLIEEATGKSFDRKSLRPAEAGPSARLGSQIRL